jgi:hypothetical protein
MADHGVIFRADGTMHSFWTWHGRDACPFTMALEPGWRVVQLDETLSADELTTLTKSLVESPEIAPEKVKERLEVPADVTAAEGETLGYRPGNRLVVSRRPSDGREDPRHDFKAGRGVRQ